MYYILIIKQREYLTESKWILISVIIAVYLFFSPVADTQVLTSIHATQYKTTLKQNTWDNHIRSALILGLFLKHNTICKPKAHTKYHYNILWRTKGGRIYNKELSVVCVCINNQSPTWVHNNGIKYVTLLLLENF